MKQYIFIDLDGTITASEEGITKSIQYALRHINIVVDDLNSLRIHIGPPLREGFRKYWGIEEKDMDTVIEKYREYYKEKGIFQNEVYDGIENLLQKLNEKGKTLIVATSKPEVYAKEILKYFQLDQYFADICGSTLDGSISDKWEVIRYALEKHKIRNTDEVIMIGDRIHDVEGAKKNQMESIGVLYGYGSKKELEDADANYIAETVEELEKILLTIG